MRTGTMIILGVAVLALVLIAGKLFLSESSFSPANPFWDGASGVMTADTRPLYGFDGLPSGDSRSTLLIVGPTVNYTADDAARVRAFLQEGGRVVVLDDFGTADSLLRNIDSPITILPAALCQDLDYYKKPSFPDRPRSEEQQPDRKRGPAGLQPPGGRWRSPTMRKCWRAARPWAGSTSTATALSTGRRHFGSYPLIARAAYGAGELFVAGDADLAINAMQDQGDDGVLTGNILGPGTLYLDVGHGQQVPPLASLYFTALNLTSSPRY